MISGQLRMTMDACWGGECACITLPPQMATEYFDPMVVAVNCKGRVAVTGNLATTCPVIFVEAAQGVDLQSALGTDWQYVSPRLWRFVFEPDHKYDGDRLIQHALAAIGAVNRPTVVPETCPSCMLNLIPVPLPEVKSAMDRWAWIEQEISRLERLASQETVCINPYSKMAARMRCLLRDWIAVLEQSAAFLEISVGSHVCLEAPVLQA